MHLKIKKDGDFVKAIICIDSNKGMLFNNRRQSQDKELIVKIAELISDKRLLMNLYSAQLFSGQSNIVVCDDFIAQAKEEDFCFIEDAEFSMSNVDDIYIFNWNRNYPADKYFDFDLKANGYKRMKKDEFVGNSHKKITLEIYRRNGK